MTAFTDSRGAVLLRVLLLALTFPAMAAAQTAADQLPALEERVTDLETARNTLFALTGATVVAIGLGWFRLVR